MDEQAIAIFCVCDEIIKSFGFPEDPQYKMTTAEVMTFAVISAMHYQADYRTTRLLAMSLRYFPRILSHSRLVRRIHFIPDFMWWMIFNALRIDFFRNSICS